MENLENFNFLNTMSPDGWARGWNDMEALILQGLSLGDIITSYQTSPPLEQLYDDVQGPLDEDDPMISYLNIYNKEFFEHLGNAGLHEAIEFFELIIDEVRLHKIRRRDFLCLIKILLNLKLNINHRFRNKGETFLHCAVRNRNIEAIHFLIDHDCDVFAVNKYGELPYVNAVRRGFHDIEEMLLDWTFGAPIPNKNIAKGIIYSAYFGSPYFDEILDREKDLTFDIKDCMLLRDQMRRIERSRLQKLFYQYPEYVGGTLTTVCNIGNFWCDIMIAEDWEFLDEVILPFLDSQPDFLKWHFNCKPLFHILCECFVPEEQMIKYIRFFLSYGCNAYIEDFDNCLDCINAPENAYVKFMTELYLLYAWKEKPKNLAVESQVSQEEQ